MGDISRLKIGIGQYEYRAGRTSANEAAIEGMMRKALDASCDILVLPNSNDDPHDVRIVGLNDSRIDVAGDRVLLEACADSYTIAVGGRDAHCDFSVMVDAEPFTLAGEDAPVDGAQIVLRPVGIADRGKLFAVYDGGSFACDASGNLVARLEDSFSEDFEAISFGGRNAVRERCRSKLLTALVASLRRFDEQVLPWEPKWVIGLSGGLDSSIVAALLTLAFGAERVVGYNLASRFNSDVTKSNAGTLASSLGISLHSGEIESVVASIGETLVEYGYPPDALQGLVLENVQARTRGNLLSTFSAIEGGVVVNNGNRIESALGYATLYGDSIGALAPIGDLTKVQLFDLARQINDEIGAAVIPENLLPRETDDGYEWETMPSAELSDGQRDPMKWFYHDWLVPYLLDAGGSLDENACAVVERYLDDRLKSFGVGKWVRFYGLESGEVFADDLDWVMSSIRKAAFKRLQAPPKIALASAQSVRSTEERQVAPEPSDRFRELLLQLKRQ